MCRLVLLILGALQFAGCASPFHIAARREWSASQNGMAPQPGEWCIVRLATEHVGPLSTRLRFVWGRVERVDDQTLYLADVMEEQRELSGPQLFRRVPYLSRLTSYESEVELLETCAIPRDQILSLTAIPEEEAARTGQSLVQVNGKWVQPPRGIDFDFDVPDH